MIIEGAIDSDIRKQINIIPIGSHSAVMRHLAARFVEKDFSNTNVCVILDGDQISKEMEHIKHFEDALEQKHNFTSDIKQWCRDRLSFLPGNTHPEKWVVSQKTSEMYRVICQSFNISEIEAKDLLDKAELAEKHNEFYKVYEELALDLSFISNTLVRGALESCPDEKQQINSFIANQIK